MAENPEAKLCRLCKEVLELRCEEICSSSGWLPESQPFWSPLRMLMHTSVRSVRQDEDMVKIKELAEQRSQENQCDKWQGGSVT